jgi:hypothetical protein
MVPRIVGVLALALALTTGCASSESDFQTFMGTTLPSNVTVTKMDGNWGAVGIDATKNIMWVYFYNG